MLRCFVVPWTKSFQVLHVCQQLEVLSHSRCQPASCDTPLRRRFLSRTCACRSWSSHVLVIILYNHSSAIIPSQAMPLALKLLLSLELSLSKGLLTESYSIPSRPHSRRCPRRSSGHATPQQCLSRHAKDFLIPGHINKEPCMDMWETPKKCKVTANNRRCPSNKPLQEARYTILK